MLSHIQHQWIKANLSLSADGHFFLSLSFTFFPPSQPWIIALSLLLWRQIWGNGKCLLKREKWPLLLCSRRISETRGFSLHLHQNGLVGSWRRLQTWLVRITRDIKKSNVLKVNLSKYGGKMVSNIYWRYPKLTISVGGAGNCLKIKLGYLQCNLSRVI